MDHRLSDQTILTERLRGRTLKDLADTSGLSIEGIRFVVAREGRKQIDRLELKLLAATQSDEVVAFVVPDHSGPAFDLALEYLQWATAQLAERGIELRVHYRPVSNGVVIALEDVSARPRRASE